MVIIMANKANSLAHTKWMCKYHIIFTPKYRRKVIYNQYRKDLMIPPSLSVSAFMGYLKGKSALMMFDRHANLKYKFGNRHFWSEGYYVSTVGLNDTTVAKYIREQEMHDIAMDKMSVKEYANPFSEAEQQAYKQEKARRKNK